VVAVLQRQEEQAIAGERAVDRLDREGAVDRERLQRQRKDHRLAQRNDRQLAWVGADGLGRHDL
jgi:hypothetical protein